jgi:hypothetical protein
VIEKYEQTYLAKIEELIALGSDRAAYENRIKEIITVLRGASNQKYFIASFPFFNEKNALVYSLIHCSGNINGFRLYKKTAWNIFDGKSSAKKTYGMENQLMLGFDGSGGVTTHTDEYCYNVSDIAKYLQSIFKGQKDVPKDNLWEMLDEHPVFPSDGYRREITKALKNHYNATESKQSISFAN